MGNDFGAFGGGVDAIGLNGCGDVYQILVDHGDDSRMMLAREFGEEGIELSDIVRTIVGWECDAGEEDLNVRGGESGEDGVEVGTSLRER